MKLWAGRFQKETDALVNDFNSSISFDARMYREDITGSIAHAAMLGRQGIIKEHEAEKIIDGLKAILADIEAGQVEFSLERLYPKVFQKESEKYNLYLHTTDRKSTRLNSSHIPLSRMPSSA